jgi:hypothetical protein
VLIKEGSWRLRRRLRQKIWPGAPSVPLMVAVATVVVAVPFLFTYVGNSSWWSDTEGTCSQHQLGCGLAIHLSGTLLFGVLVYYLFFLRREARAAASWRARAKYMPERLFTWLGHSSGGLTEIAAESAGAGLSLTARLYRRMHGTSRTTPLLDVLGRMDLAKDIADDLDDGAEPQVIVGSAAAGKTMVLVKVADCLARRGQVPVAFSVQGEEKLDFERLAIHAYKAGAAQVDEDEAKKQWSWLRRRGLVTVIVDDLEKCGVGPEEVAQALDTAARLKLRLVAASRPYALPAGFRQGRIDLEPLSDKEVIEDLLGCMRHGGIPTDVGASRMVRSVVERAEIARTPYYLSLARVLAKRGELGEATGGSDARLSLLKAYRETLRDGIIRPDAGLTPTCRRQVLKDLEAVAYVRVKGTRSESAIPSELTTLGVHGIDVRTVVAYARRLGVLENGSDRQVNFAHGTTLAYFASCFLATHRDEELWSSLVDRRWSPLRSLALVFASAEADDSELPGYICERLLDRVAARDGAAADGVYGRADWITTAAEIAARTQSRGAPSAEAIVCSAQQELHRNGSVDRAHVGVVNAVAQLRIPNAYEVLWGYATEGGEYSIRRAAIKALTRGGADAVEASIPIIGKVMDEAAVYAESHPEPVLDDRAERFDRLKAVAWVLPSLRSVAGPGSWDRKLARYQAQLLRYANELTLQRGLEAALAQGLKLDAVQKPRLPNDDMVLDLLSPDQSGSPKARFWFSRLLLLQALTIRFPYDPRPEVRGLIEAGRADPHVLVCEVARRCLKAIDRDRPDPLLSEDLSDVASRAPHAQDRGTSQLIGDIVLALNLNEYGTPEARKAFGEVSELPACMTRSRDRHEVLIYAAPVHECPFTQFQQGGCLCPYTYDPPEAGNRRELSRAFCRHQRLHATRLHWNGDISVKDLKQFWRGMEDLARF